MAAASSSQPSCWWRYRISPSWRRWARTSTIWPGKPLDRIQQARVLQVPEDLLPVAHRTGIAQTSVQDRGDEVTLLAITRDRRHDLVQVQIPRVGAIPGLVPSGPGRRRLFGQQAQEMIRAP